MLGRDPIMAFLATRDSARARRFYADVLGLRLVSDDPYALVFDAAGTVLRVQKVDELEPRPFTVLGWRVANIEATVDALVARGVRFERYHGMDQDARGVWRTPGGARVAWFKDPDGNTLSLTQLP
jgi:catechol 2,3-dioxygenase-like lactoylglutathione lyase family enzyme